MKIFFGENLYFLRKRNNLTQTELAAELDTKRSNIRAYEEHRAKPDYEMLIAIADYFGVTTDELLRKKFE